MQGHGQSDSTMFILFYNIFFLFIKWSFTALSENNPQILTWSFNLLRNISNQNASKDKYLFVFLFLVEWISTRVGSLNFFVVRCNIKFI